MPLSHLILARLPLPSSSARSRSRSRSRFRSRFRAANTKGEPGPWSTVVAAKIPL